MLHAAWLATISLLGLTGAAAAAPETERSVQSTWVAGRIEHVDLTTHEVAVRQGSRVLTLRLAPDAEILQGRDAVPAQVLARGVGQPVKVRYSMEPAGRVADMIEVTPATGRDDEAR